MEVTSDAVSGRRGRLASWRLSMPPPRNAERSLNGAPRRATPPPASATWVSACSELK